MEDATALFGLMSRRKALAMAGFGTVAAGSIGSGLSAAVAKTPAASLPRPERGNFGSTAVVGAHNSDAAAMIDDRTFFGLPRERTFFYGNLRDDDGNLYEVVRGIAAPGVAGLDTLFVQSSVGADILHVLPQLGMDAASSGNNRAALENGAAVWRSAADAKGKPFHIMMSADGATTRWEEGDVLSLTGKLLGPGLQWHIPDRDGSQFYVSQIYQMSGTALGKPVRGMMALDQSYLPAGMLMYSGQDPLFRPRSHHRCWYTWATRYRDGTFDAGHFVLGTDRIGFALLTNERGEVTRTSDVQGDIELIPEGIWPRRILLAANGRKWEFLPDPKGRMPDLLGGKIQSITPQNEGRWSLVGDRREPDVWFAWGEVASASRIGYERSYP